MEENFKINFISFFITITSMYFSDSIIFILYNKTRKLIRVKNTRLPIDILTIFKSCVRTRLKLN